LNRCDGLLRLHLIHFLLFEKVTAGNVSFGKKSAKKDFPVDRLVAAGSKSHRHCQFHTPSPPPVLVTSEEELLVVPLLVRLLLPSEPDFVDHSHQLTEDFQNLFSCETSSHNLLNVGPSFALIPPPDMFFPLVASSGCSAAPLDIALRQRPSDRRALSLQFCGRCLGQTHHA
jgi:hypothetical protein